MPLNDDYVVDILLESGLVTHSQVEQSREQGAPSVVDGLIGMGLLTPEDVSRTLAANSSMDFVDLNQITVPPNIIGILSESDARRYRAIPIADSGESVTMAIADPMDFETFDALSFLLKRECEFVCTT